MTSDVRSAGTPPMAYSSQYPEIAARGVRSSCEASDTKRLILRSDSSRARSLGGSGLGLAIVSGILQAHRGQVSLSKTSGGGLTVHIELPLHLDALAAAPLPSGAPAPDTLT